MFNKHKELLKELQISQIGFTKLGENILHELKLLNEKADIFTNNFEQVMTTVTQPEEANTSKSVDILDYPDETDLRQGVERYTYLQWTIKQLKLIIKEKTKFGEEGFVFLLTALNNQLGTDYEDLYDELIQNNLISYQPWLNFADISETAVWNHFSKNVYDQICAYMIERGGSYQFVPKKSDVDQVFQKLFKVFNGTGLDILMSSLDKLSDDALFTYILKFKDKVNPEVTTDLPNESDFTKFTSGEIEELETPIEETKDTSKPADCTILPDLEEDEESVEEETFENDNEESADTDEDDTEAPDDGFLHIEGYLNSFMDEIGNVFDGKTKEDFSILLEALNLVDLTVLDEQITDFESPDCLKCTPLYIFHKDSIQDLMNTIIDFIYVVDKDRVSSNGKEVVDLETFRKFVTEENLRHLLMAIFNWLNDEYLEDSEARELYKLSDEVLTLYVTK